MKTFKSIVKKLKDPKIIAGIAIVAVAIGISVWLIRRHREKKEGYTNAELACLNTCKSVGPNHSPARTACRNRCKASGGGSSSHTAHGWFPGGCPVGQVLVAGKCMWNPITAAAGGSSATCKWDQPCGANNSCSDPSRSCQQGCCKCKDPRMWNPAKKDCSKPVARITWGYCNARNMNPVYGAGGNVIACVSGGSSHVRCKWDPPCGANNTCSDPSRSCQQGCCKCKDPRTWNPAKKDCSGGPITAATKMMTPGKYWCTINGTPVTIIDTTKYPGTDATWACNTWRPKQCAGKCTPFGAMR